MEDSGRPPNTRKPEDRLVAEWLAAFLSAHPQDQKGAAAFVNEVLAIARQAEAAHPEMGSYVRAAMQVRLQEALVDAPMREALANLLRDEDPALERLVTQCCPPDTPEDTRQAYRVALFLLAASPESQAQPLLNVLTRLYGRVRDRAHTLEEAEQSPHPVVLPEPPPSTHAAPHTPDPQLVARLLDPALLRPGEGRALRALHHLYQQDQAHEPRWEDVARLAGLKSAKSAQTLFNRARAKLKARYGPTGL